MKKIINLIISIILLISFSSCGGYKPVFDLSGFQFKIENYSIDGDKRLGKQIYYQLYQNYHSNHFCNIQYNEFVKCSYANELSPLDPDWFFVKAAAIIRQVYKSKSKTLGIGSLKVQFGKRQRRGVNTNVRSNAGGKIIRDIVRQLKSISYVENYASTDGVTMGLLVTRTGKAQLDKIAAGIRRA